MGAKKFTAQGPSYEEVKQKLFDQYLNPCYDETTGLSTQALSEGFAAIAAQDGNMSRLALRSKLFTYILDNARIGVCLLYTSRCV